MDNGKFVTWTIYFGNKEQKLSVLRGTPLEDILKNIAKMTKCEEDKIECKNEDDAVIALTSHMPDGTEIFVEEVLDNADDTESSGGDDDNEDVKSDEKGPIILKLLLLGDDDALRVKVKPKTSWSKIFKAFAKYKGREVKFLKFLYGAMRIRPDVPVMHYIQPEDYVDDEEVQIDVMSIQSGS